MLRLQGCICRASTKYHRLSGCQATGGCHSRFRQTRISQGSVAGWESNYGPPPGPSDAPACAPPLHEGDSEPATRLCLVSHKSTDPAPPGRDQGQRKQAQVKGTGSGFKSQLGHLLTGSWTNYSMSLSLFFNMGKRITASRSWRGDSGDNVSGGHAYWV